MICSLGVLPQRLGGGPAFQQAAATWAGPGQSSPAISNAAGNVATRGPPATPVHNNPRSSRLAHSSSRAMARSGHRARNTASLVGGARFDRHPTAGRRRATAAHKGGQTVSQVSRSRRSSVRVSRRCRGAGQGRSATFRCAWRCSGGVRPHGPSRGRQHRWQEPARPVDERVAEARKRES